MKNRECSLLVIIPLPFVSKGENIWHIPNVSNYIIRINRWFSGISRLIVGMKIDEAIKRLKGIPCGLRQTSCPDQLAKALEQAKKSQ